MKHILKIVFALLFINCNAQQIINLVNKGAYRYYPQGAYFMDMDNFLEPFTGTFIHNSGNTYLKIVFGKKVKNNGLYSEDYIYGGYEYKVNGITIVNTLPETLPANTYAGSYFITGNAFLYNNSNPPCNTCEPGEKRLYISLRDGIYYRKLILKREVVNGQVQLKATLQPLTTVYYKYDEPEPEINLAIPHGEYTLIKQ